MDIGNSAPGRVCRCRVRDYAPWSGPGAVLTKYEKYTFEPLTWFHRHDFITEQALGHIRERNPTARPRHTNV